MLLQLTETETNMYMATWKRACPAKTRADKPR